MTTLPILGWLVLLAGGGEILVRGAVGAARALGVSPLLIGLTLVGFGTSTPELLTSLFAAFDGAPGIAVGNVVGSKIANILLILGVTTLVMRLPIAPQAYRREGLALVGSTVACLAAVLLGSLDRLVGAVLLLLLASYILWAYRGEAVQRDPEAETLEHLAEVRPGPRSVLLSVGLAVAGIAVTIAGARMLVSGAVALAQSLGVSDTVIGLTVVAVGTSLPELVACVVAAWRPFGRGAGQHHRLQHLQRAGHPRHHRAGPAHPRPGRDRAARHLGAGGDDRPPHAVPANRLAPAAARGGTFLLLYAAYVAWLAASA